MSAVVRSSRLRTADIAGALSNAMRTLKPALPERDQILTVRLMNQLKATPALSPTLRYPSSVKRLAAKTAYIGKPYLLHRRKILGACPAIAREYNDRLDMNK